MDGIFFDLEGDLIPDGWDRKTPLGISCACALLSVTDPKMGQIEISQFWWAGMAEAEIKGSFPLQRLIKAIDSREIPVNRVMTVEEVETMLDGVLSFANKYDGILAEIIGERHLPVVAHNGVGYDWPIIATHLPHRLEDIERLTMRSYDFCYQAIRSFGFPIGLEKIAQTMLGRGKAEGMHGDQVSAIWPLEYDKVLRYVQGDCYLTRDVFRQIKHEGKVRWVTAKGKLVNRKVNGFENVLKLTRRTYGSKAGLPKREPMRGWMKDYDGKFDLDRIFNWIDYEQLLREKR